jgi:hypothetical protein
MVKSDTTNRYNGLIQRCEDICGLGATGITSNAALYSQFIGWLNQWNGMAAHWAIMSWDGADFDDINYTTAPHGTFQATTNRDYNFNSAYSLLKIKEVQVTYDGVNWHTAKPFDSDDWSEFTSKDTNVDLLFNNTRPWYDERANGFDLYPAFTAAELATVNSLIGGQAIYVEWFRAPLAWDTTTGTDTQTPCLDLQFHHFPAVGASFEYCKLYKPDMVAELQSDLYGARTARGQLIRVGLIDEIKDWYTSKNRMPSKLKMRRKLKI